jgi:rSAM/selenodomain-associated transferase 1
MAVNSGLCPVELWCAPDTAHPFFLQCRRQFGVALHEQVQGDLGLRMAQALDGAGRSGRPLVLIGADCPALSAGDLEQALAMLEQGTEVVLGPAEDGGYYLIGMRVSYPFVFDNIPWGTSAVLERTIERLNGLGIKWRCLATHRDLDTEEDYHAWLDSGMIAGNRFARG